MVKHRNQGQTPYNVQWSDYVDDATGLVNAFIIAATKAFHDKLQRTMVNTPQGRMEMHAKGIPLFYMSDEFARQHHKYMTLAKEILR